MKKKMSVKCEPAETYATFIANNRDYMKEKCSKLTDCVDRLLAEENTLAVIKGENISLNKTCGLVSKPENGSYTALRGKCSAVEREEIRSDLENNIQIKLDNTNNREWKIVQDCLQNLYGQTERTNRVDELCTRARIKNEICNSSSTHRTVETFFNKEIQNLQCKCKLIAKPAEMPMPMIIGIGVGAFLVLLSIFCLAFCCYRRKQKMKRQKTQTNRNVVYVPGGSESQVYQEVFDDRPFKSYQQSPSGKPPSLPSRYVHMTPGQEDGGYLEPVLAGTSYRPTPPIPQQTSNPGYESPPRYSECDRDDADNGYFKPLPETAKNEPSDLTLSQTGGPGSDQTDDPSPPEGAPSSTSIPLGPVPAKRMKKDDRKVESHYYLLEDGSNKEGGDPGQS